MMARILIVDDDDMERVLERTFLDKLGYHLHFARDGEEALHILESVEVDVLVTDIVMPRIDGLSLIRKVRREHPKIGVIAISGVSTDELGLARGLGALETLTKPLDPHALVEAVKKALEQARAHA